MRPLWNHIVKEKQKLFPIEGISLTVPVDISHSHQFDIFWHLNLLSALMLKALVFSLVNTPPPHTHTYAKALNTHTEA